MARTKSAPLMSARSPRSTRLQTGADSLDSGRNDGITSPTLKLGACVALMAKARRAGRAAACRSRGDAGGLLVPRKMKNHVSPLSAEGSKGGLLSLAGLFRLAVVGILSWSALPAATIYVDDNTCPATGSGTLASPYCPIQDPTCVALSGDVVSGLPGNYPEAIRIR